MNSVFEMALVNLILLPIMVYRNFQTSNEIFGNKALNSFIEVHVRLRRFLLLNETVPLNHLGFIYHIFVSFASLIVASTLVISTLANILIVIIHLELIWFSSDFLLLIGLVAIGYSTLLLVVFSFISWLMRFGDYRNRKDS